MDGLVKYIGSKAVKITPVMRKDMNAFNQRKEEINELIKTLNSNNALRADKEMQVASLRDALVSEDKKTARDATKQTKTFQREISKIDSENQNIQNKLDKLNDKQAGAQHPGIKIMMFGKPEATIETYVVNVNNNPIPAEATSFDNNVEGNMINGVQEVIEPNNDVIPNVAESQNVIETNNSENVITNSIPTVETTTLPTVDIPEVPADLSNEVNEELPSTEVPEETPEMPADLSNEVSEEPSTEVSEEIPEVPTDLSNEVNEEEPSTEVPEETPEVPTDLSNEVNEEGTNTEVPEEIPEVPADLSNEVNEELPNTEVSEEIPEVPADLSNEVSEEPSTEVSEEIPEVPTDLSNEVNEEEPSTEVPEETPEVPADLSSEVNEEEPKVFDENNEFEPISENNSLEETKKDEVINDNQELSSENTLENEVHEEIERAVPTFVADTAVDGIIYMNKVYEENEVVPEQPIVERDLKNLSTFDDYSDYKFTFAQKHFDKESLTLDELKEVQGAKDLLSEEEFAEKRTKEYSKISGESKRLKEKVIKLGDDFTKKVDEINETYNATIDSLTKVVDDAKKLAEKERVEKIQTQRLNDSLTTSIREKEEEVSSLTNKADNYQNIIGSQDEKIAELESKNAEQADKIKVLEAKLNTVFGIVQGIKD